PQDGQHLHRAPRRRDRVPGEPAALRPGDPHPVRERVAPQHRRGRGLARHLRVPGRPADLTSPPARPRRCTIEPIAAMDREFGLKVVDAFDLAPEARPLRRPHEMAEDKQGRPHRLPRYFYEVPSHEAARDIRLTHHFGLNEFLLVDLKESQRLRNYPRYVPCAVRLLAFYLQRLREAVAAPLHIAVNGGYRSPAHKLSIGATPHMWGTAVDLYRVGAVVLRDQSSIETYNR